MYVLAVNIPARFALLSGDHLVYLDTLIDTFGDETDEPEEAVYAVTCLPNGHWATIDLKTIQPQTLN